MAMDINIEKILDKNITIAINDIFSSTEKFKRFLSLCANFTNMDYRNIALIYKQHGHRCSAVAGKGYIEKEKGKGFIEKKNEEAKQYNKTHTPQGYEGELRSLHKPIILLLPEVIEEGNKKEIKNLPVEVYSLREMGLYKTPFTHRGWELSECVIEAFKNSDTVEIELIDEELDMNDDAYDEALETLSPDEASRGMVIFSDDDINNKLVISKDDENIENMRALIDLYVDYRLSTLLSNSTYDNSVCDAVKYTVYCFFEIEKKSDKIAGFGDEVYVNRFFENNTTFEDYIFQIKEYAALIISEMVEATISFAETNYLNYVVNSDKKEDILKSVAELRDKLSNNGKYDFMVLERKLNANSDDTLKEIYDKVHTGSLYSYPLFCIDKPRIE